MGSITANHNAIRARFHAQVATPETLTTKTLYDNDGTFSQPTDALWVRCHIVDGQTEFNEMPNRKRHIGEMVASIFTPIGMGTDEALALADVIASAFQSVTDTTVRFLTPYPVNVGRDEAFNIFNVHCPYWSDETF